MVYIKKGGKYVKLQKKSFCYTSQLEATKFEIDEANKFINDAHLNKLKIEVINENPENEFPSDLEKTEMPFTNAFWEQHKNGLLMDLNYDWNTWFNEFVSVYSSMKLISNSFSSDTGLIDCQISDILHKIELLDLSEEKPTNELKIYLYDLLAEKRKIRRLLKNRMRLINAFFSDMKTFNPLNLEKALAITNSVIYVPRSLGFLFDDKLEKDKLANNSTVVQTIPKTEPATKTRGRKKKIIKDANP